MFLSPIRALSDQSFLRPFGSRIVPLPNGWEGITWDDEKETSVEPGTKQFVKFPELPDEIQVKIWIAAAQIPTILEVKLYHHYVQENRSVVEWHSLTDYMPISRTPAVTRTCFNSRRETLKLPNIPSVPFNTQPGCLLMDVRELSEDYNTPSGLSIDIEIITCLAISNFQLNDEAEFWIDTTFSFAQCLIHFPSLTELILVDPQQDFWIDVEGGKDDRLKLILGTKVAFYAQRRLYDLQVAMKKKMAGKIGDRSAWWSDPKIKILAEKELRSRYAC